MLYIYKKKNFSAVEQIIHFQSLINLLEILGTLDQFFGPADNASITSPFCFEIDRLFDVISINLKMYIKEDKLSKGIS
jgi:hypothetical protein